MRILHAHLSLLDAQHSPRSISKLEDIPLQTLNRKVFIHGSDYETAWFEYDCIIGSIRNRATRSDGREARASSSAQATVDRIMMEICRAAATLRRKTFGKHPHD